MVIHKNTIKHKATTTHFRSRITGSILKVSAFSILLWLFVYWYCLAWSLHLLADMNTSQSTLPASATDAFTSVWQETRDTYISSFLEVNSQINLSSTRTPERVLETHIQDTLRLFDAPFVQEELKEFLTRAKTWLDVWTWGWVPLLPLGYTLPHIGRTWVDARKKKAAAVNQIIEQIWIPNANATRWRVEDGKGKFDIVTARAVTYSDTLLPWLLKRVQRKWWILIWKPFTFEEDSLLQEMSHEPRIIRLVRYKYQDGDTHRCIYWIQRA